MSKRRSRFTTTTTVDTLRTMLLAQDRTFEPPVECGYHLGRGRQCRGILGRPHTHATRCPAFTCESDERGE